MAGKNTTKVLFFHGIEPLFLCGEYLDNQVYRGIYATQADHFTFLYKKNKYLTF